VIDVEAKISKIDDLLHIKWQMSKIDIPISEIKEVLNDETYAGEDKSAVRIGYPSGHTDRVVVKTAAETYIIFTSNGGLKEKLLSYIN
jgi:hypothetical protein